MPNKPLTVGMVGEDVAALHDALAALGLSIPEAETKRRFFGPGTREAVKECQARSRLAPTGICDDGTGALLNLSGVGRPPPVPPVIAARPPSDASGQSAFLRLRTTDEPGPTAPDAAEFKVFGVVRTENGSPVFRATVRAFDKDMRSEQLLGGAVTSDVGAYTITYTATEFRRAEKKSADLIVRVYRDGNLGAESGIRFNASDKERIDLTFRPLPVTEMPRLSELEQLQRSIAPVQEGVAYRHFTVQDLLFLLEEIIRAGSLGALERRIVRQLLELLSLADKYAHQTDIPLAAFYGWFRQDQPQVLDELLDVPIRTLRAALLAAIRGNIIPDITSELTQIFERIGALRFEQGRLVNHRFVVQLIDAQTSRPLTGYSVAVTDPAAEPEDQQLGTLFTDGRGACVIVFSLPGNAPANATRRLRLGISDEGVEVAEATIDARANQEEVATLRVRLRESESGDVPIGLLDIAGTSRAEFVRKGLGKGDAEKYANYIAARETSKVLYHWVGSAWLKNRTTPDDEPDDPDIPTGVNETLNRFRKCGCKDCDSAVSPTAYLAHLLEWTLEHIKDGSAAITFSQLEEEFHQPFGDLPASCSAVEQQVRQVRICVETLWRFTGLLDRADLQLATPFRNAYRHLRNQLYRAILTHLGTSFEQLRKATLQVQGDDLTAELVAAQRRTVAELLGVDETHLNALFFNIEQPPSSPSEDALQQRFGFKSTRAEDVFAPTGTPDLVRWQRERLESIWQQQDWSTDTYSGEARLPFLDPALIDESYLRTPLADNAAFALLEARRAALAAHRQTLVDQGPQQNGLIGLLESELGQSIDQLRSLYATLQAGGQPEEIAQAHETIAGLHLTPAGFTHLMGIDARLEAGEPVGATTQEIEAALASVFDILSGAHRRALFPTWVEEENDLGLVFGPKLFWLPVEPSAPVNPWQVAPTARVEWQEALHRRSSRPLIDPDQIPANYVIIIAVFFTGSANQGDDFPLVAAQPPLTAMALWQQRRAWIDGRLEAVRSARQNQPTPLATLQAALSASTLGVGLDAFAELANMEGGGLDLGPRLAQLDLTITEYRFLAGIRELAQGSASIGREEWEQLDAILVLLEKRLEFAEWRRAEQAAEITLHPHRFLLAKDPNPVDGSPQLRWLHDPIALQQWVATLEARADQLRALREGLDRAVSDAEETVLPLLRNILIMQTVADGDSLLEKAEWLDKRLLMDMRMDGCHMTTRISQAIETLQRLDRGVYTKEHLDIMQHLTLDAEEDYELEWPVLGSYAFWRAFMLVYLYPENLLHVSPPSRQSFGFTQLKNNLPSRIEPADACAAAEEYSHYFQDVFNLEVQASCQVQTRVDRKDACGATTAAFRSRVHLFAVATTSGKVYTNSFDSSFHSQDTLDTWRPVPKLSDVLEIIGAVPHETPTQQRLILLFVKVRDISKIRLKFVKFGLDDTNSWSEAKPKVLGLPPGTANDFSAVAVQKRHGSVGGYASLYVTEGNAPADISQRTNAVPTLAIRAPNGRVYLRGLNAQATRWTGNDWIPLFGDIKAQQTTKVCALIQRSRDEYLVIVQGYKGGLSYRILSVEPVISRDDGLWRGIPQGDVAWGKSEFAGAFVWPERPDVYVVQHIGGKTQLALVGPTAKLREGGVSFDLQFGFADALVKGLESWLRRTAGVSLNSFQVSVSHTVTYFPNDPEDHRPLGPLDKTYAHSGSILELLLSTYDQEWRDKNEEPDSSMWWSPSVAESGETPLDSLVRLALSQFRNEISQITSFDGPLGDWKLADQYVRQFSDSEGIAKVLEDLYDNKTTTFVWRKPDPGEPDEAIHVGLLAPNGGRVVASGGDEEIRHPPRKSILLRMPNGAFRLKLQRSGDVLRAPKLFRVTPIGDGPFDLTPVAGKEALQLRREEIRNMYKGADAVSSLRIYLKEAYNLVPIFLGYGLQRNGLYEQALLWYRQVYDYLESTGKRKIDYGLKLEETLDLTYEDAEEWLNDANNPHAIAATRENTYTRHILLMIIRCLIDYANALFSHDNVTDNARAKELYVQALRLLELKELKPGTSNCASILGQLEIDVVEPALQQFKVALAQIVSAVLILD